MQDFDDLAKTEGKNRSILLYELVINHLKAHINGNPQYHLTTFIKDPTVKGYPIPWGSLGRKELACCSVEDCDDMLLRLDRARDSILIAKSEKIVEEMREKGLDVR